MIYQLKLFDTPLITFDATEHSDVPDVTIVSLDEERRALLPLDLVPTPAGLARWLKGRTIPKDRAYVRSFLAKCGLNVNRSLDIIRVCRGLSLNDCYWVVEEGFTGTSSPEFTTNGALPKCWRRRNGQILLYKGGSVGASNSGNEPYSEYHAAQVAAAMGIDAVEYGLSRSKGRLCSTCALFTSKERAFLPVGRMVGTGGLPAVRAYYAELGLGHEEALADMIVFDAIICNEDRHLGNFGSYVDTRTNRIVGPAPLFDHGMGLFCFAGADDLRSAEALDAYVATLRPRAYDDFLDEARRVMTDRHRAMLRRLLTFRFTRHPSYDLPAKRLRLIEGQIQKRARLLLGSSGSPS